MNPQLRDRVILPLAIPLGSLALIGILVFSFSRILLAVDKDTAVAVALAAAVDILVVCAFLAARPPTRATYRLAAAIGVGVVLAGGGAIALSRSPAEHAAAEAPAGVPGGAPAVAPPLGARIQAQDLKFDRSELDFAAGAPAVIEFRNDDASTPHNVAVYKTSALDQVIFKGDLVTGPASKKYSFAAPAAGTYYFQCDVHPATMKGTVVVK